MECGFGLRESYSFWWETHSFSDNRRRFCRMFKLQRQSGQFYLSLYEKRKSVVMFVEMNNRSTVVGRFSCKARLCEIECRDEILSESFQWFEMKLDDQVTGEVLADFQLFPLDKVWLREIIFRKGTLIVLQGKSTINRFKWATRARARFRTLLGKIRQKQNLHNSKIYFAENENLRSRSCFRFDLRHSLSHLDLDQLFEDFLMGSASTSNVELWVDRRSNSSYRVRFAPSWTTNRKPPRRDEIQVFYGARRQMSISSGKHGRLFSIRSIELRLDIVS